MPATDLESLVGEVWQALLDIDELGPDQDVYALGAHSLLAELAAARLGARLDRDIPPALPLDCRTVRELAAALAACLDSLPPAPPDPWADPPAGDPPR